MPFQSALLGFSEGVSALKSAAASGGFTVSGEGVQVLLDAANELYDDLDAMDLEINRLGQKWPIGTTPAAEVYKPHFAATATDGHQGLVVAVKKLKEDLRSIRESLEKTRSSYEQSDESGVQGVNRAGQNLST